MGIGVSFKHSDKVVKGGAALPGWFGEGAKSHDRDGALVLPNVSCFERTKKFSGGFNVQAHHSGGRGAVFSCCSKCHVTSKGALSGQCKAIVSF